MTTAVAVDRVEIHILVDNLTDSLSTVPANVENEWAYLWRNGMKRLSGRCICCAAHGLSCLVTAYRGASRHTILFDTGLVVFTACSHAGVVNVLKHAQSCFAGVPLHAVVGGFHLSGGNEKVIPETVEGMRAFGLKTIAAAHCTGWRAVLALTQTFGEPVVAPSAVGKRYTFS